MANVNDRAQPTTTAIAIACSIIAGLAGYFVGQASFLGLFGSNSQRRTQVVQTGAKGAETSDESDNSSDDETVKVRASDMADFSRSREEFKLVLVARTDLGMTKGKIAAQCSHATLACYKALHSQNSGSSALKQWERYGQAKVVLQAKSEEELETLQAQALSLGINAHLIHDAGRTQIASGSATVLGVGPAPKSSVDQVTGHLKLL